MRPCASSSVSCRSAVRGLRKFVRDGGHEIALQLPGLRFAQDATGDRIAGARHQQHEHRERGDRVVTARPQHRAGLFGVGTELQLPGEAGDGQRAHDVQACRRAIAVRESTGPVRRRPRPERSRPPRSGRGPGWRRESLSAIERHESLAYSYSRVRRAAGRCSRSGWVADRGLLFWSAFQSFQRRLTCSATATRAAGGGARPAILRAAES